MTQIICNSGKVRYYSEGQARKAAKGVRRRVPRKRRKKAKVPVRAYLCSGPYGCGGWHLTSQSKRSKP